MTSGALLDVGGTGDTRAGMSQVVGKFHQYTRDGTLAYYVQDVDPAVSMLNRSFTCNIADCPSLPSCAFDVVISHVVLEHVDVRRPWEAVRTIARATRPGGLSLHVVPFSHGFERILPHLFQDSGFEVLESSVHTATYCDDPLSMCRAEYQCRFFAARRTGDAHGHGKTG